MKYAPGADATGSRDALPVSRGGAFPVRGKVASELRPVFASGLARAVLLPISGLITLGTAAILVRSVGATAYGGVIFVGTLFQLLPFADLGVGAAVTRAIAASDDPSRDPYVAAVLRRSQRAIMLSAAVLCLIAVIIGAFGAWGPILGLDGRLPHSDAVATATIVIFALQLPLALGNRVLLGFAKSHVAITVGIVQPVTALLLAGALRLAAAPPQAFVLIFPIGVLTGSTVMTLVARKLTGLHLSPVAAVRNAPQLQGIRVRVMPVALPMFVMSIGVPIGLQSDKLIISHRLPPRALSEYALASQLYAPGWLVLGAAAFALLPVFTRRRAQGVPHLQLWARTSAVFAALSLAGGAAFVVLAPFVAHAISSGRVTIGLDLRLALAALLAVQIVGVVSSAVLNRPEEMRFQAICVMAMMASNVLLSWWLAAAVGVAGPVIASAVTVGLLMTLPACIRAARTKTYVAAPLLLAEPAG